MRGGSWIAPAMVLAVAAALAPLGPATAGDATAALRVQPATIGAANGQTFGVEILQSAPVATSGAQVSIDFDPSVLQVVSIARGSAYTAAPIFVPSNLTKTITDANATGHLAQVAGAFTPPTAIPAGTASFLVVRFRVVGCGETELRLPSNGPFNAEMISGQGDDYGDALVVVAEGARVTTCVAADAVTADAAALGKLEPGDPSTVAAIVAAAFVLVLIVVAAVAARALRRPAPRVPSRGGSMRRN